jgi:ABC-type transport system involved in resistance to organic solvents, ATPase component
MGGTHEIELRGLRSWRGGSEVLRGVDLAFERGQALFVTGAAGSGKSVLLKTAAGIFQPDEGEVLFRGARMDKWGKREEAAFRKVAGFVFEDAALWANQSLYDNLALPALVHEPGWSKAELDKAVRRAVELVGFRQNLRARPADLSAGERKLVGIARALVLDPELVFMDEPSAGLDEESARLLPALVLGLKERGRSVLATTTSSELIASCADAVAALSGGKVGAVAPIGREGR